MNWFLFFVLAGCLSVASADFRSDALAATNKYRAKHGAAPLTQDATVNNTYWYKLTIGNINSFLILL